MSEAYRIRPAVKTDAAEFLRLVRELAVFEHLDPPDEKTGFRLVRDAFAPEPRFELVVAEHEGTRGLVGYAIVLRTYSSFLARNTLYLEDIYLTPAHRGTGLAHQFLGFLARMAAARGWGRIEGIVLAWNERARRFYRSTGAEELGDWVFFRYGPDEVARLGRSSSRDEDTGTVK